MSPNKRVEGGRRGKLGGHEFEKAFAAEHGLDPTTVEGDGRTKVDVRLGRHRISLKNPAKSHTQVALYSPRSWLKHFDMPGDAESFVKLFFGLPGREEFANEVRRQGLELAALNKTNEVTRQRLIASSLPKDILRAGLDWFNENAERLFEVLFVSGINQRESVDFLGWAWRKDDLDSVKLYDLELIRQDFVRSAVWIVAPSQTTLWCKLDGRKILHLQMKGSGSPKYVSWGYHGMMFHMYDSLLKTNYEVSTEMPISTDSIRRNL